MKLYQIRIFDVQNYETLRYSGQDESRIFNVQNCETFRYFGQDESRIACIIEWCSYINI